MPEIAEQIDEAFGRAADDLWQLATEIQSHPSRVLYHYTSFRSFFDLVKSDELWLTDVRFLNDTSEYDYIKEVFAEVATQMVTMNSAVVNFHRLIVNQPLALKLFQAPFIFCMSEKGDDLGQWRAYRGEAGGVSVGFHGNVFWPAEWNDASLRLIKVIYSREVQEDSIRKLLAIFYQLIKEISAAHGSDEPKEVQRLHDLFNKNITLLMSTFKHPAFEEEQEWRVLIHRSKNQEVFYRSGPHGVTPYTKIVPTTGKLPIDGLFHGPHPNLDQSVRALTDFMVSAGRTPRVLSSSIPFR